MGDNVTVIDIVAQVTDQTADGAASATRTVSKLEKSMQGAQDEIERLGKMSKIEVAMYLKDKVTSGLTKIGTKIKGVASKAWNVTVGIVDKVTAPLRALINPITAMMAGAGITIGIGSAITAFGDFEQSMANVQAVSGATDEELKMLTQTARELGKSTAFSASESANGMYYLAQAGWAVQDIVAAMPGMLNLAAAGGIELAQASDIAASTMAAFNLESTEASRVADVLAKTANASQTGVAEIGEAMSYLAPLAGTLGYSLEDVNVALGMMANKAIDSSTAGTAMRALLSNMITPTDEQAAAMERLGVSMTDSAGNSKDLMTIMQDMRGSFAKLTETEKAQYAATLAGQEGMSGMLAWAAATEDEFNSMTDAIYNSAGAAQEMADTRMDTMQGAMEELSGAFEDVSIELGSKLAPYIRKFAAWLTTKAPAISKAVGKAFEYIDEKIQSVTAAIGEMTNSQEWQNAETLWQKIQVAWDKIIAEPFDKWWSSGGQAWMTEKASAIGRGIGSAITGGVSALLGLEDNDAVSDGAAIGKSFLDGFLEGFDGKKILEAITGALKGITMDAATLLPGGEEASSTSALSAGLLAYGGVKAGGALYNTYKGVKGVWNAGKAATTFLGGTGLVQGVKMGASVANGTAGAAAQSANAFAASGALGTGAKIGSKIGSVGAKAIPIIGGLLSLGEMGFDAASGVGQAEEWVGDDSLGSQIASGAGAFLGGDHGGVMDEDASTMDKVGNVAGGALKGAGLGAAIGSIVPGIGTAIGAAVGAGVGAIGEAIGGENIAKFFKATGDVLGTFFCETLPDFFTQTVPAALSTAWDAISGFFTQTIPQKFTEMWTAVGEFLTQTVPYALGYVAGSLQVFFCETVPTFFGNLWDGIVGFFTETVPAALETVGGALTTFFTEMVPDFFGNLWDGITTFFTETIPQALSAVGTALSTFFCETLPDFFTSLWDDVTTLVTEKIPEWASGIWNGISTFFTETVPSFFEDVWGSITSFFGAGYEDATATAHATGGIMTSPHMGLVAEDGAEAIIPLSPGRRGRGLSIWERAGEMMGVKPYAEGDIVGKVPTGNAAGGGYQISVPVTIGNVTLDIDITPGSAPDSQSILQIIRDNIVNLTDELALSIAASLEKVFANMPLAAEGG